MTPHYINYWNWKDKQYRFDIFLSDDFSSLKNVKQVDALVLSKDKTQSACCSQ